MFSQQESVQASVSAIAQSMPGFLNPNVLEHRANKMVSVVYTLTGSVSAMSGIEGPWLPFVVSMVLAILGYYTVTYMMEKLSLFPKKRWDYSEQSSRFSYAAGQNSKMTEAVETMKRVKAALSKPSKSKETVKLLQTNINKADTIIAKLENEL